MLLTAIQKIYQFWRQFLIAFGFVLFGLGGLIFLSTLWFNFFRLFIWNQNKRCIIAQYSISIMFKCFLWILKCLRIIDYSFEGLDKLKQDRSCVIVANHPSLLDYVLLTSILPCCARVVKKSLLHNFFIKGVIKAAGYIPNTNADEMLPACKKILEHDGNILIFPEGTRTESKMNIKLQRGAANIALRCQVDIRIIYINCSVPFLTKTHKWHHKSKNRPFFSVYVGEKIKINTFFNENTTISARQLTRYLTSKLSAKNNMEEK